MHRNRKPPAPPGQESPRSDSGSALILALLVAVVAASVVVAHSAWLAADHRERDTRFGKDTVAFGFATSALRDAVAWFRNQPDQPVTTFAPRRDAGAHPPVLDTMDPALGLVREFEVRGNLWARYEVRHEDVADTSTQHGFARAGTVWDVGARAYVYRLVDPSKRFDQAPNRIVATTRLESQIRGIPMCPPALAAICIDDPRDLEVEDHVIIDGGTEAGLAHAPIGGLGGLLAGLTSALLGIPARKEVPGYAADPRSVFGMSLEDVRSLADVVWTDRSRENVKGRFDERVLFARERLRIENPLQLHDSLIVVDGDLRIDKDTNSEIHGIVYVSGDARIEGPVTLTGSLVVRGELELGDGDRPVVVRHDPEVVERVARMAGDYRLRRERRSTR